MAASKRRLSLTLPLVGLGVLLFLAPASAQEGPAGKTASYVLQGGKGLHDNVPVTFGAVFAPGDIPTGSSVVARNSEGAVLPTQVDTKARNPDGSLRHAVVTVVVPRLADGQRYPVNLERAPATKPQPPFGTSALPDGFDASVTLSMNGQTLSASAKDALAQTAPQAWLNGPEVAEWWVSTPLRDARGAPDSHLEVRFGLRSYGPGRPLRIEVNVENDWTLKPQPGTRIYAAEIKLGARSVFSSAKIAQPAQTRWRKVFWWSDPVDVYVKQNLADLKRARVVPNYDESLPGLNAAVGRTYARFLANNREPMGAGLITPYMPTTGGRDDIALLPGWTTLYLMTMDKRAYEVTLASGDLAGSFASHYRNEKTGRPVTAEEYPYLSTHSNYVGKPKNLEIPTTAGYQDPNVPQAAHEPSLDFIPYLVTGDKYYLEELEFWSQWNIWGTAPEYRGFAQGWVSWDEVRAQAWSLRTLAQAAFIAPDSDPMKQTLVRELKANFVKYEADFLHGALQNPMHAIIGPAQTPIEYSPWMDDYLTSALGYIVGLGYDFARPFAMWKAEYPVQRMINPDYCWILATPYRMMIKNPDPSQKPWAAALRLTYAFAVNAEMPADMKCGSAMATALHLRSGEMMGDAASPGGYPANLQPALAAAVDLGVPGAREAWAKFQARSVKPDSGFDPQWSILPWNMGAR